MCRLIPPSKPGSESTALTAKEQPRIDYDTDGSSSRAKNGSTNSHIRGRSGPCHVCSAGRVLDKRGKGGEEICGPSKTRRQG
jgi:hypothetical protein